jgi:hypothetical protein
MLRLSRSVPGALFARDSGPSSRACRASPPFVTAFPDARVGMLARGVLFCASRLASRERSASLAQRSELKPPPAPSKHNPVVMWRGLWLRGRVPRCRRIASPRFRPFLTLARSASSARVQGSRPRHPSGRSWAHHANRGLLLARLLPRPNACSLPHSSLPILPHTTLLPT